MHSRRFSEMPESQFPGTVLSQDYTASLRSAAACQSASRGASGFNLAVNEFRLGELVPFPAV